MMLGIILQTGALVFIGSTTYHPELKNRFKKEGQAVEPQAFPLTAIGTVMLVVGMWMCSFVVENSTTEQVWEVRSTQSTSTTSKDPKRFRIIWLQLSGSVTDQQFDSYAIIARKERTSILTSRMRIASNVTPRISSNPAPANPPTIGSAPFQKLSEFRKSQHQSSCKSAPSTDVDPSGALQTMTTLGAIISVVGFVLQFTGFRSSHFSAAIAQLITTATMVIVRAYLRRDLALRPAAYRIPEGFEMEWMATRLASDANALWPKETNASNSLSKLGTVLRRSGGRGKSSGGSGSAVDSCTCTIFDNACSNWGIHSGAGTQSFTFRPFDPLLQKTSSCYRAVKLRERIGRLSRWTGTTSEPAIALSAAIEVVMNILFSDPTYTDMAWTMQGLPGTGDTSGTEIIQLSVKRENDGKWKASAAEIEAVLGLWRYSIRSQQVLDPEVCTDSQDGDWLRENKYTSKVSALRLLGTSSRGSAYLRDLVWYMGDALKEPRLLRMAPNPSTTTPEPSFTVDSSLVFGFKTAHEIVKPECRKTLHFCSQPLDRKILSFDDSNGRRRLLPDSDTSDQILLGILSDASLEKHIVQDLFSTFMWAVARKMDRLGGKTTVLPNDSTQWGDDWRYLRLQDDALNGLAAAIDVVASEWLGGLSGIYWSIVPPLSELDKLSDPLAVIEHIRASSLPFEMVADWHQATAAHQALSECCRTFSLKSEMRRRATAAIFNFCWVLGDLRREIEEFNVDDDDLRARKEDETKMLNALSAMEKDGGDLIRNLLILYRFQNRPLLAFESRMAALGFDMSDCLLSFNGFKGATSLHLKALNNIIDKGSSSPGTSAWDEMDTADLHVQDEMGLTWLHWHYVLLTTGFKENRRTLLEPIMSYRDNWKWQRDAVCNIEMLLKEFRERTDLSKFRTFTKLQDLSGWTIFHYAAQLGEYEMYFERLIRTTGWVDSTSVSRTEDDGFGPDLCGRTPFHYVRAEGIAKLLVAITHGRTAPLNAIERDGSDVLMRAAKRGLGGVATVYLDNGANPKSTDGARRSVLHWAAFHGNIKLIRCLRKKGADSNARDAEDQTPLHWTRASEVLNDELWDLFDLRSEYADIRDKKDRNVLHFGAAAGTISRGALTMLLQKDRDLIEFKDLDKSGRTPLGNAAAKGNKKSAQILLELSTNLWKALRPGGSIYDQPIAQAFIYNHESIVRLFLNYGTGMALEVNGDYSFARNKWDSLLESRMPPRVWKTGPMTAAVGNGLGNESVLRMLFTRGASPTSSDARKALKTSISRGNESMAVFLLNRGCQFEENFADPSSPDRLHAAWLLSLASYYGMYETVRLMLELGHVEVDETGQNVFECYGKDSWAETTVLWWKLMPQSERLYFDEKRQRWDADTFFNQSRAEPGRSGVPNATQHGGLCRYRPALYNATVSGQDSVVQLLLRWGAIVNHEDERFGTTALWEAVRKGHENVVRLLLRYGARLGTPKKDWIRLPRPKDEITNLLTNAGIEFESYIDDSLRFDDRRAWLPVSRRKAFRGTMRMPRPFRFY